MPLARKQEVNHRVIWAASQKQNKIDSIVIIMIESRAEQKAEQRGMEARN
jgi:hypothetical protein